MLQRFNPLRKLVSSCCLLFRLTLIIPKAKITIPTWPFHGNISSYPHYISILLRRWGSTMSWCEKPQHITTPFRVPFRRIRCSGSPVTFRHHPHLLRVIAQSLFILRDTNAALAAAEDLLPILVLWKPWWRPVTEFHSTRLRTCTGASGLRDYL